MSAVDGIAPYLRRIRQVCPDVEVRTAQLVPSQGQNNAIVLVDDAIVFRFPRYAAGIARLEREVAILRAVRGRVGLATPEPLYAAFGEREVGSAFVGYPIIPGEPLDQKTLDGAGDADVLVGLGRQVGAFLRELHALPVADVLPDEAAAFDPLAAWRDLYARIRWRLFPLMRPDAHAATARHFEAFFADPAGLPPSPALVHGDFGTGNILYDPKARAVSGVIDFGSAGPGDPAVDFAALPWSPPPFYDGIASAYPEIRTAAVRVRFYRGTFALQEALFGAEQDDEDALRRGIAPYR